MIFKMKKFVVSIFMLNFAIGIVGGHVPMIRAKLAPPFPFVYLGQDLERASEMKEERVYKSKGKGIVHLRKRSLVCGVGINDSEVSTGNDNEREPSYVIWKSFLARCYGKQNAKKTTYIGCSVCDEWKIYSNFKQWFDDPTNGYKRGYHVDKDILIRGNKVYSPETCCFVPPEINTLIIKHDATRGNLPIGVSKRSKSHRYRALLRKRGKYVTLGSFGTPEEAFQAYKQAKEAHIKDVATKYYNEGKITEKVYNALMNYKVEITD